MKNRLAKAFSMVVLGALALMALTSLALAQEATELKDAHKMMSDG
jgi:CHASE1-domain containing sensor protein